MTAKKPKPQAKATRKGTAVRKTPAIAPRAQARAKRTAKSVDIMDRFGIDKVCDAISDRKSIRDIAAEAGVSPTRFLAWLKADSERSARVREVRMLMAKVWDEEAERVIKDAEDDFGLRKGKELAHHYRWRAAKVAPAEYGERVAMDHGAQEGNPLYALCKVISTGAKSTLKIAHSPPADEGEDDE